MSGAKLDEPDTVAVSVHHFGRHLQRQPRLADAADADQRQQTGVRQQPLDLDQLTFAPNERRQRFGQIGAPAFRLSVLREKSGSAVTGPTNR